VTTAYREKCLSRKEEVCHICDATEEIVVHHADGDKSNDDLENLLPVCRSCHNKIHGGADGYEDWYEKLDPSGRSGFEDRKETTLRSPRDLIEDVDEFAEEMELSRNAAINFIVRDWMKEGR
jgi:hypothetical protein